MVWRWRENHPHTIVGLRPSRTLIGGGWRRVSRELRDRTPIVHAARGRPPAAATPASRHLPANQLRLIRLAAGMHHATGADEQGVALQHPAFPRALRHGADAIG